MNDEGRGERSEGERDDRLEGLADGAYAKRNRQRDMRDIAPR